jgi:hypothetical protein
MRNPLFVALFPCLNCRFQGYVPRVCRCFAGKNPRGGARVSAKDEVSNCLHWIDLLLQLIKLHWSQLRHSLRGGR